MSKIKTKVGKSVLATFFDQKMIFERFESRSFRLSATFNGFWFESFDLKANGEIKNTLANRKKLTCTLQVLYGLWVASLAINAVTF